MKNNYINKGTTLSLPYVIFTGPCRNPLKASFLSSKINAFGIGGTNRSLVSYGGKLWSIEELVVKHIKDEITIISGIARSERSMISELETFLIEPTKLRDATASDKQRLKLEGFTAHYQPHVQRVHIWMSNYLSIIEDHSKLTEKEKQTYKATRGANLLSEADLLLNLSLLEKEAHAPIYTEMFEEIYLQIITKIKSIDEK